MHLVLQLSFPRPFASMFRLFSSQVAFTLSRNSNIQFSSRQQGWRAQQFGFHSFQYIDFLVRFVKILDAVLFSICLLYTSDAADEMD